MALKSMSTGKTLGSDDELPTKIYRTYREVLLSELHPTLEGSLENGILLETRSVRLQ